METVKAEIKLDSSQYKILYEELERRNLSIEELVTNLLQQYLQKISPTPNNIIADSESTAGLGASKITDTDEHHYKYSAENLDPKDISTLSEIKQLFNLDDNQQYHYSVDGDFLTLNLGSESPPHFADIKKILAVIEEIEKLEFDDDLTDLSKTYKQRLYSTNRKDSK